MSKKRFRLDIWNPEENAYEIYAFWTAESAKEICDLYAETRKKYGDEPRHQMLKKPRLFLIGSKRDPETRLFEIHAPKPIAWPNDT